jgi:heme exporter protein D
MNLGPHAAFIIAAYLVATTVIGALIAWVFVDHRTQQRLLTDLEARGMTRRSSSIRPTQIKETA